MWTLFPWFIYFAAAAAKSLQLCPTPCDPIDGSPPGPAVPGILQARTLEWVAISSSNAWNWKVKVKSLSCVRLLATLWTAAYQDPPSMGFSRQEYWSGVPLPSLLYILVVDFCEVLKMGQMGETQSRNSKHGGEWDAVLKTLWQAKNRPSHTLLAAHSPWPQECSFIYSSWMGLLASQDPVTGHNHKSHYILLEFPEGSHTRSLD